MALTTDYLNNIGCQLVCCVPARKLDLQHAHMLGHFWHPVERGFNVIIECYELHMAHKEIPPQKKKEGIIDAKYIKYAGNNLLLFSSMLKRLLLV